jgi:hypothetical protein
LTGGSDILKQLGMQISIRSPLSRNIDLNEIALVYYIEAKELSLDRTCKRISLGAKLQLIFSKL